MNVKFETSRILLSVVSHGDTELIERLLADISRHCQDLDITVVLTENDAAASPINAQRFSFPLERVQNARPLSFGASHNQAFASRECDYFCVVNPGIHFEKDPITPLLEAMKDDKVAAAVPLIYGPDGELQDTVRKNVTLTSLISPWRRSPGHRRSSVESSLDIDWTAAIFVLIRSDVFRQVEGFDERNVMYGEDADLCERLHASGRPRLCLVPTANIMHNATPSIHHRGACRLHGRALGLLRLFLELPKTVRRR